MEINFTVPACRCTIDSFGFGLDAASARNRFRADVVSTHIVAEFGPSSVKDDTLTTRVAWKPVGAWFPSDRLKNRMIYAYGRSFSLVKQAGRNVRRDWKPFVFDRLESERNFSCVPSVCC